MRVQIFVASHPPTDPNNAFVFRNTPRAALALASNFTTTDLASVSEQNRLVTAIALGHQHISARIRANGRKLQEVSWSAFLAYPVRCGKPHRTVRSKFKDLRVCLSVCLAEAGRARRALTITAT